MSVRPDSDVSSGGWVSTEASDFAALADESDATLLSVEVTSGADPFEVGLAEAVAADGFLNHLLPNVTNGTDGFFGKSCAVEGEWGFFGESFQKDGTGNGKVHIYRLIAGVWTFHKTLSGSPDETDNEFGRSLSVNGGVLVVGAPFADFGRGRMFVFEKDSGGVDQWGQVANLQPPGIALGWNWPTSVAVSGTTIAGGSFKAGSPAGKAWVFYKNGSWVFEKEVVPAIPPVFGEQYGWSTAIDGDTLVIGAKGGAPANAGRVRVFGRNEGGADNWGEVAELIRSDVGVGDQFGQAVAVHGDTIAAGRTREGGNEFGDPGGTYIFERVVGVWSTNETVKIIFGVLSDNFGASLALKGDILIVGAPELSLTGADKHGRARLFRRDEGGVGNWGLVQEFFPSTGLAQETEFGRSSALEITAAGRARVLVGAPESGLSGLTSLGGFGTFWEETYSASYRYRPESTVAGGTGDLAVDLLEGAIIRGAKLHPALTSGVDPAPDGAWVDGALVLDPQESLDLEELDDLRLRFTATQLTGTFGVGVSRAELEVPALIPEIPPPTNLPPVVAISTPLDGTVFVVGTTVQFSATAVDPEDGDLTSGILWTSDKLGLLGTGGTINVDSLTRDTHRVTASSTDTGFPQQTGSASIIVTIRNTPETEFDALAAQTFSEIYLAVETSAFDPVAELTELDFVTTAPRLFTEAGEIPASTGFKSVIFGGWKLTRRLTQRGKFTAPSTFNAASLVLSNAPPEKGDPGPLDRWLDLEWNDRPIVIKAGGLLTFDGQHYPYSSYHPIFTGVTEDLIRRADGSMELTLVGRAKALSRPVVEELYRGFGGGVAITGSTWIQADDVPVAISSEVTIEVFGVVRSLPAGSEILVRSEPDVFGILINGAGQLGVVFDGAETYSSFAVTLAQPLAAVLATVLDAGGLTVTYTLYAGRDASDLTSVLAGTVSPFSQTLTTLQLGRFSTYLADFWDTRFWERFRTEEEILAQLDGPLANPGGETGLAAYWKFGEGTGATAASSPPGKPPMEFGVTDLVWISSLEGDDPIQFGGGGPAGQAKPRVLGPASNVELDTVDSQRNDYQWALAASNDLERVYSSGGPLFPDETVTTVALGEIAWDDTEKTMTIVSGGHTFHRFVPGQGNPAVPGQRVTFANAGPYDGIFRVDDDDVGIDPTGLVMGLLVENGSGPPTLPTGDLPAGSEIRTSTPDRQYTFALSTSTIRLPDVTVGQLTADVIGELSGASGSRLSELFEILVGESVDISELTFDPVVGVAFPKGGRVAVKTALDLLARSGMAYWIEDRAGGYKVGTWTLPSGTPIATVAGSKLSELGDGFTSPIIGRISKMAPIPTKIPASRLTAGYARTWVIQDAGSLVGALTPANRDRLSEPLRFATRTAGPALRQRYPNAEPLAPLETYLLTREDAEQHLALAAPLLTVKPRFYDAKVEGMSLFALDGGDVIWLQHPEPTFGIVTPVKARIMALVEDTSRDTVQLEAFTGE